jgi:protein O-mannosyl-transferase
MSRGSHGAVGGLLLIYVLTILAYVPAMTGGFVFDDDAYVSQNPLLHDLPGLARIWADPRSTPQYYPLVYTTFWIEQHVWGLDPLGYHTVNVLLHATVAVMLWTALSRLGVPGAWLAAAIFALHPVHVESVAWITERKNVLSGVFYLASILTYMRFAGLGSDTGGRRQWGFYLCSLVLFACALLSKTATCPLPVVLLLLVWWKRPSLRLREVLPIVPMLMMALVAGLTTAWLEKHHVGAQGETWSEPLLNRCLIAGRALWFYAGKLVWPTPLAFVYPRWQIDSREVWQYAYPLAALALAVMLWLLRRRIGKGPLVAALFFGISLGPVLGFIGIFYMRYSYVADHFQYLASIGPITLLAAMITTLPGSRSGRGALSAATPGPGKEAAGAAGACTPAMVCSAVLLVTLAALTWRQGRVYKDLDTLWRDTLAKNPDCWMAHNNLGTELAKAGRVEEAEEHVREALRLSPRYEVHQNLAGLLTQRGKSSEAIGQYREAIRLNPQAPDAYHGLARALLQSGDVEGAVNSARAAVTLAPQGVDGHNALGVALQQKGDLPAAVAEFAEAARLAQVAPEPHLNLGRLLIKLGRIPEGLQAYDRALELAPDSADARIAIAWTLATTEGVPPEAVTAAVNLAEEAGRAVNYRRFDALDALGAAYAASGRYKEAVGVAEQASGVAGSPKATKEIQDRFALYRAGKRYVEPPLGTASAPGGR